jgi:ectoine hydroxylase
VTLAAVRRRAADRLKTRESWLLAEKAPERGLLREGHATLIADPLAAHPALTALVDQPTTVPKVWGLLGWNIYVYDPAAIVTPPVSPAANDSDNVIDPSSALGTRWHRDGGRINMETDLGTSSRLAVKVGFFITDVSVPGRGNTWVVPGSHRLATDSLGLSPDEITRRAIPICGPAGSAIVFDRRLIHSASVNTSTVTRKAVMYGYSYRWVRQLAERSASPSWLGSDPVRLQLLGMGAAYGRFFPNDPDVPLRRWLRQHDPDAAG